MIAAAFLAGMLVAVLGMIGLAHGFSGDVSR